MCGRYVIFTSEEYKEMKSILKEIEKYFKSGIGIENKLEIFPGSNVPTIKMSNNKPSYGVSKWGLPMYNSKKLIINARGETIDDKRMFQSLKPLIFPANGYYEWHEKAKYFIKPIDLDTIYFAGLYDSNNNATIITTSASSDISFIHERMPVILSKQDAKNWMDTRNKALLLSHLQMIYKKIA